MSLKRSRAALEADLQAKQSPFVKYGTALPPVDPDIRDDGSFVPVWQQEVRDDKGRRRLHGAFTGGFSAGYFNTVGSKEGWTPSTFVSSRSSRHKDAAKQRIEDFMDEDDLAEREASQQLGTSDQFSGLGSTATDEKRLGGLMDVFRPQGDTMGIQLLQKMGWRKGQGVGARVRRGARTEDNNDGTKDSEDFHLFAPDNTETIKFINKIDSKGLGYSNEVGTIPLTKPSFSQPNQSRRTLTIDGNMGNGDDSDGGMPSFAVRQKSGAVSASRQARKTRATLDSFYDDDSDNDDTYGISPNISYNRIIGGNTNENHDSAVIKPKRTVAISRPNDRPLISRKTGSQTTSLEKCRDGRLPLDGFELTNAFDASLSLQETKRRYPIPKAPATWKSSKASSTSAMDPSQYVTTGEAAKSSQLDPQKRGDILGEERLQGKSIFDYLTPETRDRIVQATGRIDLPPALGQPLSSSKTTPISTELQPSEIPELDKSTANAALARGVGGWMPYTEDEAKRARYRAFIEYRGGIKSQPPPRPSHLKKDAWLHELREFAHAARVFKPVSGLMATRFTSANSGPGVPNPDKPVLDVPSERKKEDPAEEAARLGMFGPLTRTILQFYPTRLVCKRFNVKPPSHADLSTDTTSESTGAATAPELVSKQTIEGIIRDASTMNFGMTAADPMQMDPLTDEPSKSPELAQETVADIHTSIGTVDVNAERNEALESQRAGEAVFKAIFGSDDEDDD